MNNRVRAFCFTINNFNEGELKNLDKVDCKYLVYGLERGELHTPHIQGYIEFKNGKTISAVSKLNGFERAHIEVRKGTPKEASDYCKKEGNFKERGKISEQGKRTELQDVTSDVQEGIPLDDIAMDHPETWIKYHKGITSLWNIVNIKHRNEKDELKIIWIYGKAGVGKTLFAWNEGGVDNSYIKDGTAWWDGYCGQRNVIIDDFDGHWPYRDLLRLLDKYPYQGQIKGGYVKINSNIIITCEFPPEYFWKGNELAQITRRINKIFEKKIDSIREPDQLERHKYALECQLEKKNADFPMS